MRLFVGVGLDERARAVAMDTAQRLQRRIGSGIRARWVRAEHLHFTVRFIGAVDDSSAAAVLDALRPGLSIKSFDVEFGACGVFPPKGAPRVVWVGLSDGQAALGAMHEEFSRRLAPLGLAAEQREFSAHLTLARIGDAPPGSIRRLRETVEAVRPEPVRYTVTCATVFQSQLSRRGAVYHPLFDVPCTG
jgi:2'-5' RNA ligase